MWHSYHLSPTLMVPQWLKRLLRAVRRSAAPRFAVPPLRRAAVPPLRASRYRRFAAPPLRCAGTTAAPPGHRAGPAPCPADPSATIGSVTADSVTAQDEVVDICRDLIRIDTSNPGDHSGLGERQAAEYTAARLAEAGLEPTVLESHPKRTSVVARLA